MGLWATVMDWLMAPAEDPLSSRPVGAGGSSRHASATALAEPSDAAVSSATEMVAPWWEPTGERLVTPAPLVLDEADPIRAQREQAVLAAVDKILNDRNLELPHLPWVPQQVIMLTRNPDTNMREIASLVAQDQVLSAEVLRRANSAAMGGVNKIANLDTALVRLGMRGIRSFMISRSVKHVTLVVGGKQGKSRGEALWRESLASAYVMSVFADCFGMDSHEAFLAGLLHDIGKIVVLKVCHDAQQVSGLIISDELYAYTCRENHEAMGGMIAKQWELPENVVAIASRHHACDLADDEHDRERALIQLTDATVSLLGYTPYEPFDLLALPAAMYLDAADNAKLLEALPLLPEVVKLGLNEQS